MQGKHTDPVRRAGPSRNSSRSYSCRSPRTAVAVVACLACLAAGQVRAADEEVPSFKKGKDRETKEFVKKVAVPIVKVARFKPQNIEVARYEYTKPKEGRTELKMKVNWNGAATEEEIHLGHRGYYRLVRREQMGSFEHHLQGQHRQSDQAQPDQDPGTDSEVQQVIASGRAVLDVRPSGLTCVHSKPLSRRSWRPGS